VDRSGIPVTAPSRLSPIAAGIALAAALTGGVFSWFASAQPDGLEWSIERAAGTAELKAPDGGIHQKLADLQGRVAVMPDYDLPSSGKAKQEAPAWPGFNPHKSLAGVVGGIATLLVVLLAATLLRRRR
jgi:cobalt/nickel transport system permease protein